MEENEFYGNFVDSEPTVVDQGVVDATILVLVAAGFVAGAALITSFRFTMRLLKNKR